MSRDNVCSFYVSEFHLITILMPYANEKILKGEEIELILQEDLRKEIKKFLKIKDINYEINKILKLNWNKSREVKNGNMIKNTVIVAGDEKYVENMKYKLKDRNCSELVCAYKVDKMDRLKDISNKYDYFLNTLGKNNLIKNSQSEQKIKTIQTQF